MSHVMLDIETWGTSHDAVIVSVGAVNFDIATGKPTQDPIIGVPSDFYCVIDAESCLKRGLTMSADTIYWWFKQSPEAIDAWLTNERTLLDTALLQFDSWFRAHKPKFIWANAPTFDCAILRTAFERCDRKTPWHYRQERCVRTYVSAAKMAGMIRTVEDNLTIETSASDSDTRTKHNALDDCHHQIRYIHEIWKFLQRAGTTP